MGRCVFMRWGVVLLAGILPAGVWAASARAASDSLYYETRTAMGTTVEVYLYAADAGRAAALFEAVFEEIERVEAALSTYRSTSELSRINTYADAMPVTTDPEVFGLIGRALAFSRQTDGAFDITVGRLMKAWGFFRGQGRFPSTDELAEARKQTGWQYVTLDTTARAVRLGRMGLQLDMGAIGKGYAIDQVVRLLRAQGVSAVLIGTGQSSYYAVGAPPGEAGWPIKVPVPFDRAQTLSTVRLRDAALSTSGNYEKFFELEGRRYCHIMDPRTGRPVEGMVQVTVIAPSAADSDALATSVFVLGPDAGKTLLDDHPGTAALLVTGTIEQARVVSLGWPEAVEPGYTVQNNNQP